MNYETRIQQKRLEKAISESSLIKKISDDLYLLELLSLLNKNQDLPRTKGELYSELSLMLVYQWDTLIYTKDKQHLLRKIAFFIKTELENSYISKEKLQEIFNNYLSCLPKTMVKDSGNLTEQLITQLQENKYILRLDTQGNYSFVDSIFLDYFCAWELVWQYEKVRSIDIQDYVEKYKGEESWQEILSLIDDLMIVV